MEERPRYVARAWDWDGKWWSVSVEGLDGAHTQARRLSEVEELARDLIVNLEEEVPDSFDVLVTWELPAEEQEAIQNLRELRRTAQDAERKALDAGTEVVGELVKKRCYQMGDVSRFIGLSYQRVAQLAKYPTHEERRALLKEMTQIAQAQGEYDLVPETDPAILASRAAFLKERGL